MKLKTINFLFASLILLLSCDEKSDSVTSEPLLGVYTISKSVLTADATSANGAATVESGTDITATIRSSFLAEIDCLSNTDKGIEVAENNKIFFVCRSEGKQQDQGSWLINDARTEFQLNLLIQNNLVPLKLVNLVESSTKIAGNVASIPVPPILLASVNPLFSGITDQAVLISIDIELERLN